MRPSTIRIGDLLVESKKITNEQLTQALALQKEKKMKIGELLISEGMISEIEMLEVLEQHLGIPAVNLTEFKINREVLKLVKEPVARRLNIMPLDMRGNRVIIATSDPLDLNAIDEIRAITGQDPILAVATSGSILRTINANYDVQEFVDKAIKEFNAQNVSIQTDNNLEDDAVTNSPIVRLVNTIFQEAVKKNASDIHIEPYEDRVRVRFRVDGGLIEAMSTTKLTHQAIVTRIKIIGRMDIAEKRKPQDGRIETTILAKNIDLRISILPTVHGEKIVIRLLDRDALNNSSDDLQLSGKNQELLEKIMKVSQGMILMSGPTGSGKTTTLYKMLKKMNRLDKNIVTVEDPVEYRLDGVNQIQVNPKSGLTFAESLRSILRQDPDTIMVGEIRDTETAEIASRAAITGHVVLSTIHTNDAPSTVTRLVDMGIDAFLVSTSVVGVIAQRLVKKVCKNCAQEYTITNEEMDVLQIYEPITLTKGTGCNMCGGTGYQGRTAIHEILVIDRDIRKLIIAGESSDNIKDLAVKKDMVPLHDGCLELVLDGTTTVEEFIRTTYTV